jgi:hypothetical protein
MTGSRSQRIAYVKPGPTQPSPHSGLSGIALLAALHHNEPALQGGCGKHPAAEQIHGSAYQ